jgi:hypothetical protein
MKCFDNSLPYYPYPLKPTISPYPLFPKAYPLLPTLYPLKPKA